MIQAGESMAGLKGIISVMAPLPSSGMVATNGRLKHGKMQPACGKIMPSKTT